MNTENVQKHDAFLYQKEQIARAQIISKNSILKFGDSRRFYILDVRFIGQQINGYQRAGNLYEAGHKNIPPTSMKKELFISRL